MPIEFHVPLQLRIPIPLTQPISSPPSDGVDKLKPILLVPDIKYLTNFANGELGIADSIKKQMVSRNLASPPNLDSLKIFTSVSDSKLSQDPKSFVKPNGKISVPSSAISLTSGDDFMGLKALEKTAIKSIFETQKPYMEIIKLVVENLVKLEDVAARLSTNLDFTNPIKPRGLKPKVNPRALGYKGDRKIEEGLSKLASLQEKTNSKGSTIPGPVQTPNIQKGPNGSANLDGYNATYEIVSEQYSTGKKLEGIDYDITYRDIIQKTNGIDPNSLDDSGGDIPEDDFSKNFPETVVLSIFNDKGEAIAPPAWLADSGKWFGKFEFVGPIVWWWKANTGDREASVTKPEPKWTGDNRSWERVNKKDSNGNDIPDEYEKSFTSGQIQDYINFVHKGINLKVDAAKPDTGFDALLRNKSTTDFTKDKEDARSFVLSKFNTSEAEVQLDALSTGGFLPGIPQDITAKYGLTLPQQPFRPVERVIKGNNLLLDPEGDYEMRIIKVSTTFDVTYLENQGTPETTATIVRFLKNSHDISMSDNTPFDIYLYQSGSLVATQSSISVSAASYDNLGLDENSNTNAQIPFNIETWRRSAPLDFIAYTTLVGNTNSSGGILTDVRQKSSSKTTADSPSIWEYRQYNSVYTTTTFNPVSGNQLNSESISIKKLSSPLTTTNKKVVDLKINSSQTTDVGKVVLYIYDDSTTSTTPPSTWLGASASTSYSDTWTELSGDISSKLTVATYKLEPNSNNSQYFLSRSIATTTNVEIAVPNGTIEFNGFTFDVELNTITRWKSYIGAITPEQNKKKVISIQGTKDEIVQPSVSDLPINAIRVTSNIPSGKIISGNQITNNRLKVERPYAADEFVMNSAPPEMKVTGYGEQEPFQMWRYPTSETDLFTMYIVEAVLPEKNKGANNAGANAAPGGGSLWYKRPHSIGAIKVLLSILTDIMTKLIPKIKQLLKLIKNPSSFIFDILQEKLAENFDIFGEDFQEALKSIPPSAYKIAAAQAAVDLAIGDIDLRNKQTQLKEAIKELSDRIKNSPAYNFVHIHPETGAAKFLFDGSATIKFLTIIFGMKLEYFATLPPPVGKSAAAPLSLIFKLLKEPGLNFDDCSLDPFMEFVNDNQKDIGGVKQKNDPNGQGNVTRDSNQYAADINGLHYNDVISEWYSTGKFVKGVDYQYTYLSEEVAGIIKQADDLLNANPDDPKIAEEALDLYDQALKKDPGNKFIGEKIEQMRKKYAIYPHPLFNLLLSLITTPLKIIFGIIKWIMCFFKGLNIGNLIAKLKEFFSFKWILDFFKPLNILGLLGIKFDITKFKGWIKDIKTAAPDTIYDLSEVIDMVFIPKLFKVNKDQLLTLLKQPLGMLNAILCLIEAVINGFIDFVWGLLGLGAILKAPHLNLCKKNQQDMTLEEVMDLLNGQMKDNGPDKSDDTPDATQTASISDQKPTEANYDFIYEIRISDGRLLRDLNREELEQWLEDNGGYQFIFNF